jgi:hypothetical protein
LFSLLFIPTWRPPISFFTVKPLSLVLWKNRQITSSAVKLWITLGSQDIPFSGSTFDTIHYVLFHFC